VQVQPVSRMWTLDLLSSIEDSFVKLYSRSDPSLNEQVFNSDAQYDSSDEEEVQDTLGVPFEPKEEEGKEKEAPPSPLKKNKKSKSTASNRKLTKSLNSVYDDINSQLSAYKYWQRKDYPLGMTDESARYVNMDTLCLELYSSVLLL